jgi:excisionase family DNA binding protein
MGKPLFFRRGGKERKSMEQIKCQMLRVPELAKILNIKPKTIRNWISNGTCPIRVKKVRGAVRFYLKDVERYLEGA